MLFSYQQSSKFGTFYSNRGIFEVFIHSRKQAEDMINCSLKRDNICMPERISTLTAQNTRFQIQYQILKIINF